MSDISELVDLINKVKQDSLQLVFDDPQAYTGRGLAGPYKGLYVPEEVRNRKLERHPSIFFRDKDPSEDVALHELTHFLDERTAREQKEKGTFKGKHYQDSLSETISAHTIDDVDWSRAWAFGTRNLPEHTKRVGIGWGMPYAWDPKESIARLAAPIGSSKYEHEKPLISEVRRSVKDLLKDSRTEDTKDMPLYSEEVHEFPGKESRAHPDIRHIVEDIQTYKQQSEFAEELWNTLPFDHPLKEKALENISSRRELLKEADKKSYGLKEKKLGPLKWKKWGYSKGGHVPDSKVFNYLKNV